MSDRIDFPFNVPTLFHRADAYPEVSAPTTSISSPSASSAPLLNIPKRKSESAQVDGDNEPIQYSTKFKRQSPEEVAKRIIAYQQAASLDLKYGSPESRQRSKEGRRLGHYVNAQGILTLKGEQTIAAANGHEFCPITVSALMLWIDKDNRLSKDEFAKRFGLCAFTFASYTKANHTLTAKGENLLRSDQGHRFAPATHLHIKQFQERKQLQGAGVSLVNYCNEMNLNVASFQCLVHADGTPTKTGAIRFNASLRNANRLSEAAGSQEPD